MDDHEQVENYKRRQFFKVTGTYGLTTALMAASAGTLMSTPAVAQTAQEERDRQKSAKYTMTFATAYIPGVSRQFPIMQLDFKENIQNMSGGQIYVTPILDKVRGIHRSKML